MLPSSARRCFVACFFPALGDVVDEVVLVEPRSPTESEPNGEADTGATYVLTLCFLRSLLFSFEAMPSAHLAAATFSFEAIPSAHFAAATPIANS